MFGGEAHRLAVLLNVDWTFLLRAWYLFWRQNRIFVTQAKIKMYSLFYQPVVLRFMDFEFCGWLLGVFFAHSKSLTKLIDIPTELRARSPLSVVSNYFQRPRWTSPEISPTSLADVSGASLWLHWGCRRDSAKPIDVFFTPSGCLFHELSGFQSFTLNRYRFCCRVIISRDI